ncbi:hypothetical protein N7488_006576 [Penicillium malachiteum]|nr:hypothetical protein N7488_006576 [Penicillium malachiteum]
MSDPKEYMVCWICAVGTEMTVAQAFLDEKHEEPDPISSEDNNHYACGRMEKHKVVIAVLPMGEYGVSPAASVPPTVLCTALSGLKSHYESQGHQLEETINKVIERSPRLRKKYKWLEPASDKLYRSKFIYPLNNQASCVVIWGDNLSHLVMRKERVADEDNTAIHFGKIASANQLMKDVLVRDQIATENGVLCFEMEAAGLMNHFPCLVIRGICNYADSHKNKDWQGYSAMVAVAYARDLLSRVAPIRIEKEKRAAEVLYGSKST